METNPNGDVALAYFQPIPKVVTVGKTGYAFVVKHGISLCWVKPEDAPVILQIRNSCRSCGTTAPAFHFATPLQIKVWDTGHY